MFQRVAAADMRLIVRGLFILLTIIAIGVGVAEQQLAVLTQRPEQERFFYLGRNEEYMYSVYAFGYGLTLGTLYPFGTLSIAEHRVLLTIADYTVAIPTKIEIDNTRVWYWLDMWYRQFVEEAFASKNKLINYWGQLQPQVKELLQTLRAKTQNAIQQAGEYINEYR